MDSMTMIGASAINDVPAAASTFQTVPLTSDTTSVAMNPSRIELK
jgi:hypothetical protein